MLALDDVRTLHDALGLVVILPQPDGTLLLEGPAPAWLQRLGGDALHEPGHAAYALLDHFLPEAQQFWKDRGTGRLRSGIFTLTDSEGQDCHVEVSALALGNQPVIVMDLLSETYVDTHAVFQKAREGFLLFERAGASGRSPRATPRGSDPASDISAQRLATWCDEMRRPVNAVIGSSEVLLEHSLTAPQRDMVGVIRRSAQTLLGMIDNVIDFSRARGGKSS